MLHLLQTVIEPIVKLFAAEKARVTAAMADLEAKLMAEIKALEGKVTAVEPEVTAAVDALGQKVSEMVPPAV